MPRLVREFREYPRTLHRPDGSTRSVGTDAEKADALADGWLLTPCVDLTGNRFGDFAPFVAPAADEGADVVDIAPRRKKGRG